MDAAASDEEFTAVFKVLAKHLFPDGCPDQILESAWPSYDRTVTTFTEALTSYEQVVDLSLRQGLSALQTHAMIVPFATSSYFNKTIQAAIPCQEIPTCALERLISSVTASEKDGAPFYNFSFCLWRTDALSWITLRSDIIRFDSLVSSGGNLSRLCSYSRRLLQCKEKTGLASLSLLLQLYTGVATETRLAFQNQEWEKSFQKFQRPIPFVNISSSDLDHSWSAYQLSKVAGIKPSVAHGRSVVMDRWLQGDHLTQKEILEKLAFRPLIDELLVERVLPLWDGRDADLLMHALPLKLQVLPYLDRHFMFGSSVVQYAIGEFLMRFVEEGSDGVSDVVVFANDLLLRALIIDFSPNVAFIAFDFLEKCTFSSVDPTLLYLLGVSAMSWERFRKLIIRYKNEEKNDDHVLDELIGNIRKLLTGGSNLEDLCHSKSVKERLAEISKNSLPDLAKAIQSEWPDIHDFWKLFHSILSPS